MALTAAKCRSNLPPGRHGDGGTLFLYVAPGGSKSWVQRLTISGRRVDVGLGGFPLTSLAQARDLAFENRRTVRAGGDPLAAKRKAAGVPTFRQAAERTHKANRATWKNEKHAVSWWQTLERHAMPRLGAVVVDRITGADVLSVLTPIWTSRPETARRIRQRIRTVLGWCQAHNYIENNVAGEGIDGALPALPKVKEHQRALDYREVKAVLEKVEASGASMAAKLAFRFLVLCASRSGEVRGARWSEIDLDAREWRIPGSRMKGGRDHVVPLTAAAIEVLDRARALQDESDLIFPSPLKKGRPLSDMSLVKLLRDLQIDAVPHGCRASFRTFASERTTADHATMEMALAHAVGSAVERSYARSNLLAKRRRLMDQWAAFLTGATGKVVALGSG